MGQGELFIFHLPSPRLDMFSVEEELVIASPKGLQVKVRGSRDYLILQDAQ